MEGTTNVQSIVVVSEVGGARMGVGVYRKVVGVLGCGGSNVSGGGGGRVSHGSNVYRKV